MIKKIYNYLNSQTKWFWLTILVTIVIDAANSAYIEKIQEFFFEKLSGKDIKSMFWLLGFYVFFIVLLILASKMTSHPRRAGITKFKKNVQKFSLYFTFLMIAGYGIIMMMPSISIMGLGEESTLTNNQQYTFFLIMIGLFFVLLGMAFANPEKKLVFGHENYLYLYIPTLILATVFVDFSTALWKMQLFDPNVVVDPDRVSRVGEFITFFPLYAVFFAAPRFILVRKSYNIFTLLSAAGSTAYFVWQSLAYIEL